MKWGVSNCTNWTNSIEHNSYKQGNTFTATREFPCILTKSNVKYRVEIKCQLDATDDFYCRSYCLLNMFRAPLCPSSGAREYYTGGCCLWYLVLWFSSCRYDPQLHTIPTTWKLKHQTPQAATTCNNILELLMMGIVVPETSWASNKICNKNHLLHLAGILFPHINDDARSKSLQVHTVFTTARHFLPETRSVLSAPF